MLFLIAASGCRRLLVLDGSAFVCLCCVHEGLNAGRQRLLCRGLGDGRVMLRIRQMLAGGPAASSVLVREGEAAGITAWALRRAKKTLGVRVFKARTADGEWNWALPPADGGGS